MTEQERKQNQFKRQNEFNRDNYDRYSVMFPKGMKQVYKELAEARGYTLNGLINALLDAELKKFPIDSRKNQ